MDDSTLLNISTYTRTSRLEQTIKEIKEVLQGFNITIGNQVLQVKESGNYKYEIIFKLSDFLDEFIFVSRVVFYIRNRPYKLVFETFLANLDFIPVCIKTSNTKYLMRRHILKLNALLRFGSFSLDEPGVIKFHLLWNFETNVHLAMRTKEDIEKWIKIGLATTMSTLKVNMTKLLTMAELIDYSRYNHVIETQPPKTVRELPKHFWEDQEKLKKSLVEGIRKKVEQKQETIVPDPYPPYAYAFYQKATAMNVEYHGRLTVGGYASIHVVKAKMRIYENTKADSNSAEKEKYFLVKVPRQKPESKMTDQQYVMSIAKGENMEEDPRINRERTVISSIEEKKFQHIARYYDDCPEGYKRALLYIENYMPQNLHDFNATKELGIGTKLSWLYQLAHVLCHFKRNNLVHVDLKPSNIVLAKNFFLKVIDFAEALVKGKMDKDEFKRATTIPFSAPEALDDEQENINFESDVFSFAHIAYELLGGKLMVGFKKTSEQEVRASYKNREFKFLPIANWLNYLGPQYIMQYMYYMIMLCSTADPSCRFPQEALVNFIKEFALYTEKLF